MFAELMLLGFISLLLTVGQGLISRICISEKVAGTFHPCAHRRVKKNSTPPLEHDEYHNNRHLLALEDKCAPQVSMFFFINMNKNGSIRYSNLALQKLQKKKTR